MFRPSFSLICTTFFNDFEDAIQFYVAKENKIQYLLTRNKKDFKKADIFVMSADEYLNISKSKNKK